MHSLLRCFAIAMFLNVANFASGELPNFRLNDGDRVVFLGDGLIEQEQYHGWVELMLTTAYPENHVTFRNLGWSADTPDGKSRCGLSLMQAGREPADEGWKQLQKQLELTKPTVVCFGYGMASSLENGLAGIDDFATQFKQLIQYTRSVNSDTRFVFLSPIGRVRFENHTHTSEHPAALTAYTKTIAKLAAENDSPFVDLSAVAQDKSQRRDAVHLNDAGYRELGNSIAKALKIKINDGWQQDVPELGRLRKTILKKNQWFFHRSRPANMAYVFGFRKREQGQNAVEIPQFDELIEAEEQVIAKQRSLGPATIETKPPRTKSAYAEFTQQPTPEFTVAEGWEVNLWAENPMLNKPIQMNFDPSGRLWVASSEAYPMIEVGQTANDRIIVLEDSDADGTADKSSVFADGLLIPTGVLPSHDGVYVAQSTDLLHLQDTNGDGKADKKTRVLSGFGTEDTHHNLHTLRWGPDGRLYMNQSVYTRTDAETPRGITRLKAGGGFRFNPNSLRMQVFFAGLWNSWGHQFDKFGRSFMTDGAGFSGIAYVFPGAQFSPLPGGQRDLVLISPGRYPKFCSAEIVAGDSFPKDWQQTFVTCDFRANRVTRFSLVEKDSGFETVQEADLLRTSAATFRPIDVKQGPDGAIYIADWSNPIINHGEVDFRDPRRDRWHGRIWRVARKDAETKASGDLTKLPSDQLLTKLTSNDRYQRDQARRVLISRPDETKKALMSWTGKQQDSFARLQALWLHQAINAPDYSLLQKLLDDSDADIRTAAARVLADWSDPNSDLQQPMPWAQSQTIYEKLIADQHPRVRLEAIGGLTNQQNTAAARLALRSLASPTDRFINFALAELVGDVAQPLLNSIQESPVSDRELEFVLTSVKPNLAASYVRAYLASHPIPRNGDGPWIGLIAKAGDAPELNMLLKRSAANEFSDDATVAALRALRDAQRLRKKRPNQQLADVAKLFTNDNNLIKQAAVELAGTWRLKDQLSQIANVAAAKEHPLPLRTAAVNAIRDIGSNTTLKQIVEAKANREAPELLAAALAGLAKLDPNAAIDSFLSLQTTINDEASAVALWRSVLSGKDNEKNIVSRLPSNLAENSARAGLRVAREGGRKAPELVKALNTIVGGESSGPLSSDQIAAIAKSAASDGDPHRGELVYQQSELACVTCHAISGIGGKVGPDLSSIGASAPIDYIAESMYAPNAKVKENYHSVVVVTADGEQITGIEAESTPQELVLRNAENKLIRIPRDEIEDRQNGPSLMPAGLIERLSKSEQIDLIRFLSLLGKPGEFDTSQRNIARAFDVLAGTHRVEQLGLVPIINGDAKGWKPLYARVSGDVTQSSIQLATKQPFNISLVNVYLRTYIEVGRETQAEFEVSNVNAKRTAMWVGDKQLSLSNDTFKAQLPAGKHRVILRLDARQLPDSFRLTSDDVNFVNE